MTKPNIAILNPLAEIGGAEISLLELLHRSSGHFQFHLIIPENGPLRKKAEEAGVKVCEILWPDKIMQLGERNKNLKILKLAQGGMLISRLAKNITKVLKDIKADVLITNGIKCHIVGAISHKRYPIPLIWYLRDGLEGRKLSSIALNFYSARCSAAIAISHFIAGEARKILPKGVPAHVLYNIVDFEKFQSKLPHPSDLVKKGGEIWFGMIGAITPLKGQDLFLEAGGRVVSTIPNSRFVIVGTNFYKTEASLNYERELHVMTQSPSLKGRVIFLGFRNDIPEIISTLDILVQPNRGPEGLGRAVIEAMACGVPAIAVDRWGPAELIQDGKTGVLFPWMNIEALSNKMILLGKDKKLREELGESARKWIHENLIPERIAVQFRNILKSTLSITQR
jgi:glycosyltransferase involved in cell wall biosynthesis